MNLVLKISCNNYSARKKDFDSHKERAAVFDETKTTIVKSTIRVVWSCSMM